MLKHHEDSIKNMHDHYRADPEVTALFLVGSVATNTERPNSDIDSVAVVSQAYFDKKKDTTGTMEVVHGKCTYEGGYFDTHFITRRQMEELAKNGSEPMRNLFTSAQVLFCNEPGLPELAAEIAVFPEAELDAKKKRYYCTMKQFHLYFWLACKPQGFHRNHVANGMVFSMYRLILLENKILFPSMRKLEECVANAKNKPDEIIAQCHSFMRNQTDDEAAALVETYEKWTSYNFPKERSVIINGFADPWEWF